MSKKLIFILNVLLIVIVSIGNLFYQLNDFNFSLKCFCSICFSLIGIINLAYAIKLKKNNIMFYIFMAIGLFLAMLGDILLEFDFIIGATTFALGHIGYFIAYFIYNKSNKLDYIIITCLALFSVLFIGFFPLLEFDSLLIKIVCIIYAIIISIMLGKAIANALIKRNIATIIIAIASALFFFSDLMLVFNWFMDAGRWSSNLCMATYYPANLLLALSMYINIIKE